MKVTQGAATVLDITAKNLDWCFTNSDFTTLLMPLQ